MKNKITVLFALFLCVCFIACSCGADVSALENLCYAARDFELAKAANYVSDDEGYFQTVLSFAEGLTEEQKETAEAVFSQMAFSEFEEKDGVCTLNVKYVDFSSLIAYVDVAASAGASATESLGEILESGRLQKQFMKTKNGVRVTLLKNGGNVLVPLGYAGVNAEFTSLLGLDTFLRWYSLQR